MILLVLMLLAAPAAADFLPDTPFSNDARGLTGAGFLKQPIGARATAMGGSYAAASGDAESIYWNPAGLAGVKKAEVSASYDSLMETAYSSALSLTLPVSAGTIGASLLYHSQAALDGYDAVGDPTGSFTPYDAALAGAWARAYDKDSFGVAFKLIQQKLAGESATGWAIDAGWQQKDAGTFGDGAVDVGLAARNFGSPIALGPTADPLPLKIVGGVHWHTAPKVSTLVDIHMPVDRGIYFSVGQEYRIPAREAAFALRLGYAMGQREDLGGFAGFTAGLGMDFQTLRADYAWVPLGDLGSSHRISLGFRF